MVLIKCCDISNEVRPMEVSEPWVDCLLEEYFNQVMPLFVYIKNIPDGHQSFLTSTARYLFARLFIVKHSTVGFFVYTKTSSLLVKGFHI